MPPYYPLRRLSAYLYDVTKNQTYHDAALLFYTFIDSVMYNHTRGYVISSIDLSSCTTQPAIITYKTALYLEALSVLAEATNNSTLRQM